MARALLTGVLLGVVTQAAALFYGYLIPDKGAFGNHFLLALASTFLLSLAHSMTMFFFIGTGKQIKELAREHRLGPDAARETVIYKNRLFPPMMFAIVVTMAQFILGGGAHTGAIPVWIHHVLGWITLLSNVYCLVLETRYLVSNSRLMDSVFRAIDS
jgi:hypothetical protein